jgi:hypothetical protein
MKREAQEDAEELKRRVGQECVTSALSTECTSSSSPTPSVSAAPKASSPVSVITGKEAAQSGGTDEKEQEKKLQEILTKYKLPPVPLSFPKDKVQVLVKLEGLAQNPKDKMKFDQLYLDTCVTRSRYPLMGSAVGQVGIHARKSSGMSAQLSRKAGGGQKQVQQPEGMLNDECLEFMRLYRAKLKGSL